MDALHRLARRGFVELRRDYVPYLEHSLEAQPDFPDEDPERSLWMGETGIRLVLQRLAPSQANLERLSELIAANERDERCELMWGSPGTILAGRELGLDVTASIEWLRGQRDAEGLWTQQLYGQSSALSRSGARVRRVRACARRCRRRLGDAPALCRRGGRARQLAAARGRCDSTTNGDGQIRTQWCHGAPGIVATLAHVLDEELAVAGGELTWRAGPLRKGANLCHGTAGNGYAFLALLERTGDERWLTRARAFAMHAAAQVEQSRSELRARPLHALDGRPRHGPLPRRLHRRSRGAAASVSRVLVTGMSGTGKSTALAELGRRGFRVVDTDSPAWSELVPAADRAEGEWLWREDRVAELLASEDEQTLYVSGCMSNQGKFYDGFDAIVLLSAPAEVILERVESRTTNDYGKGPRERDLILFDLGSVEPLLRATCTHEIDASGLLDDVVDALIAIGENSAS